MKPSLRIGVAYDFRNPPDSGIANPDLYASILDQVAWLDTLGLDLAWFTEHHFLDDGYLPSWIPVAAAMAARTKHVRLSSDICLMPFQNPVRLAEDLAVIDNISNGRVEIGIGMGYAPHEFRGFGIPVKQRVSRTEEGIAVLQHCFSGEKFNFTGKRFQFEDVVIKPGFVQPGGPPLWIAAMSEAGARRAARFGANLLPQGTRSEVLDPWREDMAAAGQDPDTRRIGIIRSCLVTDDPERDWPAVKRAERYRMEVYLRFNRESGDGLSSTTDVGRIPQSWVIGDVDHCVRELTAFVTEFGITDLVTWAVPPGMTTDQMNPHLEKFVKEVAPRLKAAVG